MLLRLVREHDVLLESFRPGVLDRLGVGYERLREENPGLVYCAITGYGQDGPNRDRAGHDMNYLGARRPARADRRARTARRCRPPGQIADLGGGALMAAVGILAALRERERSGEGQLVDVSMSDGALSWLAMVAAQALRRGPHAARAASSTLLGLAHLLPPVRVRRRLGRARRAGAEVLAGVVPRRRARGPDRAAVRAARLRRPPRGRGGLPRAHARRVGGVRRASTTAAWSRCSSSTRRSTPSWCARGRWSSSSTSPARREPVKLLGLPIKLSRTPGDPARAPGPALGEHTDEVLAAAGYAPEEIAALKASRGGRRRRPPARRTAPRGRSLRG